MTPSIHMDGKTLTGSTWVRPSDWQTDDIELGLLPCLKGASPDELPELGPPTDDTPGAYPICGGATPSKPHPSVLHTSGSSPFEKKQ